MIMAKGLLLLMAIGFGVGYSIERASQALPQLARASQREPVWLRDLDISYRNLVGVMNQKGFSIDENPRVCRQKDVIGYYTWGERTIKICTDRIASLNPEPAAFRQLLQQTIAHEATHVAQSCRQRRQSRSTLDLDAARLYGLPPSIQTDIRKALTAARYSHSRSVQWRIEAEAMALENTPDQVITALRSFCP